MPEGASDLPLRTEWAVLDDTLDELLVRIQNVLLGDEVVDTPLTTPGRLGADVNDDQRLDPVRMGCGIGDGVAAAHGEADEDQALHAQVVYEIPQITDVGCTVVLAVRSPFAIAVAALIDRDDAIAGTERQRSEVPHVGILRGAMRTQEPGFVFTPPVQVVEADANIRVAADGQPAVRNGYSRDGCRFMQ